MLSANFPASRHPISRHAAYLLAAATIGLALFASGTPSPLYGTYSQLWGFDSIVLTLVYATYAFGVLLTLLLAGRLSDEVGRRPVLVVSMAALVVATIPFMLADSVVWLFVARAIQGLATGLALSAASASLLDLHPKRDPVSVSLANGVASCIGMGTGVIISAAIVQFLPAPRVLPYVLLLILFVGFLIAAWRMVEPVEVAPGARFHLTPQRPSVPAVARRPFVLAALAVISSWSIAGLFLSLGPELAALVYKSDTHLISATGIVMLALSAAVSQVVFGRWAPWRAAALGSLALAAGMGLIVAAAATESAVLFTVGAIVTGAGLRRRLPRWPALALERDPARAPGGDDVGLLPRRLRVALDPGGDRGLRRRTARRPRDLRDLRLGDHRHRPAGDGRGLAPAPARSGGAAVPGGDGVDVSGRGRRVR